MTRKRYFTGSRFEERGGYARGLRDGDMVFMSGCVGFNYRWIRSRTISSSRRIRPFEISIGGLRSSGQLLKTLSAS